MENGSKAWQIELLIIFFCGDSTLSLKFFVVIWSLVCISIKNGRLFDTYSILFYFSYNKLNHSHIGEGGNRRGKGSIIKGNEGSGSEEINHGRWTCDGLLHCALLSASPLRKSFLGLLYFCHWAEKIPIQA